jgi:hypothetical protein
MKTLFLILVSTLSAAPVMAEDLTPAPPDKAIQQYRNFWKTDVPDSRSPVVWKLYVFHVIPSDSSHGLTKYIIAGLTSSPGDNYYVRLKISELNGYLGSIPHRCDVIVVKGRVLNHRDHPVKLPGKEVVLKFLTMDLDAAISLSEQFDPSGAPVASPVANPPSGLK